MQSIRPRLILTVLACAMGSSFQFYHSGVINTPEQIIRNWINRTYSDRGKDLTENDTTLLWSVIVSVLPLGGCIGCLCTRWLVDHVGRRNSLIWNGALNVVGCVVAGISKPTNLPELLILSRLLLGFNLGSATGIVPIYLTEIAPIKYRGAFGTIHMVFVALGEMLSLAAGLPNVLGTESLWPVAMALPSIPALAMAVVLPFCPESPKYLYLIKKEHEMAKAALDVYIGPKYSEETYKNIEQECELMNQLAKRNTKQRCTLSRLIMKRQYRRPLIITIIIMVGQQFTGVVALFSYSTDLFERSGLALHHARISTVGIGAAYFVFTLTSIYLIEKLGRRPLSLFQLTGCLGAMSSYFVASMCRTYLVGSGSWTSTLSIVSLVLFMCIYGAGSPIPWIIASEFFSLEVRATAVGVSTFVAWFLAFVISLGFLPLQVAVGENYVLIPFLVVSLICIVLLTLFLPETRNRPIEDIVKEFQHKGSNKSQMRRYINPKRKVWTENAESKIDGLNTKTPEKSVSANSVEKSYLELNMGHDENSSKNEMSDHSRNCNKSANVSANGDIDDVDDRFCSNTILNYISI